MDLIKALYPLAKAIVDRVDNKAPLPVQRIYISALTVQNELLAMGITWPFGVQDTDYIYTREEDWAAIIAEGLFNMPPYKLPRILPGTSDNTILDADQADRDCDNFAWHLRNYINFRYGVNAICYANGNVPGGYHAYNLVRGINGWYVVEPQTGEIWPFLEAKYKTDKVLF